MRFDLPGPVLKALGRLEDAGFAAYVVGGCVRDWVMGMTPHDYDLCTAASPEDMKRVFRGEKTVETGVKHGTLTVLLDGMPLEITVFRVDGEYLDGRHPASVRFTDRVEEDLSRRDFTVNAMAYSPARGIVDPFGGQADCARGVVRCVGDPEKRFEEDALRILRALRFSARLRFPIEESTARAVRGRRETLGRVSRERVAAELTGLLLGDGAGDILARFPEVVAAAVPGIQPLTQSERWPMVCRRVDAAEKTDILRWAALLMDAGEETARRALRGLKSSVRLTETVALLTARAADIVKPENVLESLMVLGPEHLPLLIDLQKADRLARGGNPKDAEADAAAIQEEIRRLTRENACWSLKQLAVNGRDMAALGLSGPGIGAALNELLLRVVRGELPNQRETLLTEARKIAASA